MPEQGNKLDNGKLRLDLVPISFLRAAGRGLTYGANKYGDNNWRGGLKWGRTYGALLRHLTSWWDREDVDPESLLSHLDHAACNLAFLIEFIKTRPDLDDRPNPHSHEVYPNVSEVSSGPPPLLTHRQFAPGGDIEDYPSEPSIADSF